MNFIPCGKNISSFPPRGRAAEKNSLSILIRILPVHRLNIVPIRFHLVCLLDVDARVKLFELLFLLAGKFGRNFDRYRDVHIARTRARFQALSPHAKDRAALRAVGDQIFERIVYAGHFDLAAERRRFERDRQFDVQVFIFAFENFVRLDAEHDDKIARNAARRRRLTVSLFADVTVRIRTRGDIEGNDSLFADIPFPFAVGAGIGDLFARAAARVASRDADGSAEQRILRVTNLTAAPAFFARFIRRSVLRARAFTRRTRLVAGITNLLRAALRRVEETQNDLFGDIFPLRIGARRRGSTSRKAAENIVEYVPEPRKARKTAAAAEARKAAAEAARLRAGVVEFVVVRRALLRVGKHFVRFVDLFEFCRRVRVVRVQVGVILFDEFAVRRFYFVVRRFPPHAQYFVIVFICHNKSPLLPRGCAKSHIRQRVFDHGHISLPVNAQQCRE